MCKDAGKHSDVKYNKLYISCSVNQINTILKRTMTNIFSLWKKTPSYSVTELVNSTKEHNYIVSIRSHADIYDIINDQQYHQMRQNHELSFY